MNSKIKGMLLTLTILLLSIKCNLDKTPFNIENTSDEIENNIFYVSPIGNDSIGNGANNNPWKSVSYSVSQIKNLNYDSTTLYINVGRYSPSVTGELFPLYIPGNLTLIGADKYQTIIDFENERGFEISDVSKINIKNILFENGYRGIICYRCNKIEINNCIFINFNGGVIYIGDVAEVLIKNSLIKNNSSTAISIGPSYGAVPILSNNIIVNNQSGIEVTFSNPIIGGDLQSANDIYSNFEFNIDADNNGNNINASYNYWGTINKSAISNNIEGDVNFVPYTDSTHSDVYQ